MKNAHPKLQVSAPNKPHFINELLTLPKRTIVFLACWRLLPIAIATWLIQRGGMVNA